MWGAALIRCYDRRVQNQPLKWWHVRWGLAGRKTLPVAILLGKIVGVLGLVAAVICGVLYLISPWLGAQRLAKFEPRLSVAPVGLPTTAQAPLSNATIDRFGFKFQLPKKEIAKTRDFREITVASFRDGGGLLFWDPSDDAAFGLWFSAVRNDKRMERLLGQDIIRSKFTLMQAAMSATPDQVKWWRFRSAQNERAQLLLMTKFAALMTCRTHQESTASPVYAIAIGDFRGFEYGNPDVAPYDVNIEVFDGADRRFALNIAGQQGHKQILTQEELNAMVASIRPSPSK
jgi:hypothetical protein